MNLIFYISIISLSLIFSSVGCSSESDETDTPIVHNPGNAFDQQIISENSNFEIIKRIKGLGNITAFTLKNNLLYLGNYDGKFYIYDVENALSPKLLSTLQTNDIVEDIAIDRNRAYLANNQEGLVILDINNISAPTIIKKIAAGYARGVELNDGKAYVAGGYNGITVVDLSNLNNPVIIDVEGDYTDSIAIKDNFAFTTDAYHKYSIVTDLNIKEKVAQIDKSGSFYEARGDFAFTRDRNSLFIADGIYGFGVYNIANTNNITNTVQVIPENDESMNHITLSHNEEYAYVSTSGEGVDIYDISNLYNPKFLQNIDLNETPNDMNYANYSEISEDGKYLFVSTNKDGFTVISLIGDTTSTSKPSASIDDINLNKWDLYGSAKNENGRLIVALSIIPQ